MMIFIKTGGLILIFSSCALAGISLSGLLGDRVRALDSLIRMLETFREELSYYQTPIRYALEHIIHLADDTAVVFLRCVCDGMDAGFSPPESWSVAAGRLPAADKGDRQELASLAGALGGSDLEGQKAAISGCLRALEGRRYYALQNRDQKARIYRTLGVLAGAAAVVIVI